MIKKIEKSICMPNGVDLMIDLDIPLGDDYVPEALHDDFIDGILVNQIVRGVNNVTEKYVKSPLPNLFLKGQKIIVTTNLRPEQYGLFNRITDDIHLDPDDLAIGLRGVEPEFLFGHEMGHKIQKYRDTSFAYSAIASFFDISPSNELLLWEVYSDIVGNIVSYGYVSEDDSLVLAAAGIEQEDEPIYHLGTFVTPEESAYIKKRVLHSIYHV